VSLDPDAGSAGDLDSLKPGERLFFALGQLYSRWSTGRSPTHPREIDVEDLARILGVWNEVEFVQEAASDKRLLRLHFPGEVLVIDRERVFPWRLLDAWEWASEQEFGTPFWDDPRR
jgi:hypothetical protein